MHHQDDQPPITRTPADETSQTRFGPRPVPEGHRRPPGPVESRRIPPHGDVSPDGSHPWPRPSRGAKWLVWGGTGLVAATLTAGTVIAARHLIDLVSDDDGPARPRGEPAIRTIAMPADANPAGDIFGGWLMAQMDLAAGNVAARRARGRCATVSVDRITFLQPVYVGDEVSLYAEIVRIGRTSMTIQVDAWRRSRDGEEQVRVTDASFVFVALDQGGRPRVIGPGQPG